MLEKLNALELIQIRLDLKLSLMQDESAKVEKVDD